MKSAWWLVPAFFLAGLGVGRWTPPEAREGAGAPTPVRASEGAASIRPVTGMLQIPERRPPRDEAAVVDPDASEAPREPSARRRAERRRTMEGMGRNGGGLDERIAWAADAWRMRAEVARGDFMVRAGLDGEATAQFDVLMQAMNIRIEHAVSAWADHVAAAGVVAPEDGARLLHEVTGALVLTYDEMDRTLPSGWRAAAGSGFDVVAFVDPAVAMPLAGIEAVLEASPGPEWP